MIGSRILVVTCVSEPADEKKRQTTDFTDFTDGTDEGGEDVNGV